MDDLLINQVDRELESASQQMERRALGAIGHNAADALIRKFTKCDFTVLFLNAVSLQEMRRRIGNNVSGSACGDPAGIHESEQVSTETVVCKLHQPAVVYALR